MFASLVMGLSLVVSLFPVGHHRLRPRHRRVSVAGRLIVRSLEPFKIPIKTLPNLHDLIDGKVELAKIRSLSVEDLLVRAPVGLDIQPVKSLIAGRRVMVTGAGGSIGSELCRQIAGLKPAALVMFDRYENTLHAIRVELDDRTHTFDVIPVIGDVTDAARVNAVLAEHQPEIVFHAAAHKHVPLMEENPCEAVKNNVRGTRVLAQGADAHGVDRFIMISTDKAVNPTSVMGASKRVADLIVHAQAVGSGTSFSIVRFGNVLASNGVKLLDMARDLIRLSGLIPEDDIKIELTGVRPGEKLYEELVGADEEARPSAVENILCVRTRRQPEPHLFAQIDALEQDASAGRSEIVIEAMKALIGTFGRVDEPTSDTEERLPIQAAAAVDISSQDEQPCPRCHVGRAHRSRARTVPERIKKELTSKRLFRCSDCGWRGWLVPLPFGEHAPVDVLPTPDLASLDAVTKPQPAAPRHSFSPRNLQ